MVHCGQFNCLQGDSLELRRLKPDPLNLLVNTDVGSKNHHILGVKALLRGSIHEKSFFCILRPSI